MRRWNDPNGSQHRPDHGNEVALIRVMLVPARVQRPFAAGSPGAPKTPSSPPAQEGRGPVPGDSPSLRRPRRPVASRTAASPRRSASTNRSSVAAGPRRAADRAPAAIPVRGTATAVRPSAPRDRSPHRTASAAGGCVRAPGACLQRERPACAALQTAAPLRRRVWATSSSAHRSLAARYATLRAPSTTNRNTGQLREGQGIRECRTPAGMGEAQRRRRRSRVYALLCGSWNQSHALPSQRDRVHKIETARSKKALAKPIPGNLPQN